MRTIRTARRVAIEPQRHQIEVGELVWFRGPNGFASIAYRVAKVESERFLLVEELAQQPAFRCALVRPITLANADG
jgi:hypothetical protein